MHCCESTGEQSPYDGPRRTAGAQNHCCPARRIPTGRQLIQISQKAQPIGVCTTQGPSLIQPECVGGTHGFGRIIQMCTGGGGDLLVRHCHISADQSGGGKILVKGGQLFLVSPAPGHTLRQGRVS
jgi:hypothetical protein